MRQVRFPLKIKLLTLMMILIALSLTVFVWIALKTFKEDKSAYIFESLLNKASSESIILAQKLGAGSFQVSEGKLLFSGQNPEAILTGHTDLETTYEVKIVIPQQGQFYEWQSGSLRPLSADEASTLKALDTIDQSVKEVTVGGRRMLMAYDYASEQNFVYMVSLPLEKAYSVTTYLINKSLYYGLFILGIAMILSVLLARPLTSQLETLFGFTQEIAQGNFEKRVKIRGHDEVGALSDSVNDMADKIVLYMQEMKEKARLENEVMVAQLVQSSFFPTGKQQDSTFSAFGHFEPASECGGDWWSFFDHGPWRVLFIADATGHGVPAALLTATINCCKSSLSFILETRPELLAEPHEILRYMNQAVCGAGKEIQVTCFVASFNRDTKLLVFSNSSHTPPLLFNASMELTKESFRPLTEANGPRLGQDMKAKYPSASVILKPQDTIFFYTDGLIEAQNTEGSRFGERRLIKALTMYGARSHDQVVEGVMSEFKSFTTRIDDDLTAVSIRVMS